MSLTTLLIATALVLVPNVVFAQTGTNTQTTRAQVKQELADLVATGYRANSALNDVYPDDIRNAQLRVEVKRMTKGNSVPSAQ